ncbi:unnamed protein product [Cuscuta campestris]|uniref:Uncharacterized protein n=1 Tax=Cuscuta campestris TaxID=132261 RepID=A0A484MPH8_9ASTE|nr:unnamed protein product [Cuscuta campestris]
MPRCKNASSGQETAAEENERPWRREGSKYIHIQTGLAFNTRASVERFHNIFLTKEIVSPKIVNKDLFKSATYAPSKSIFLQQGLLRFIHFTYEFFCPNLIRQFYANLRTTKGGSPSLISYVDGKTVFIDDAGLTSLFGLRRGEITENLDETFQDEAIWRQLGLDHRDLKFRNSSNPSVVNLTLIQRVQQYIFSYVLLPRDSNHGVVNKDDIRLFHVLLNDVKFDWVHFFIVALSDGTRFSHLRFAIPIVHILAHCKVDLTRDTQVPVKKTCFITEAKFSRIMYREEGNVAPNLDLIVAEEEEESQNENQAESSQAGDGASFNSLGSLSVVEKSLATKAISTSETHRCEPCSPARKKPEGWENCTNLLRAVGGSLQSTIPVDVCCFVRLEGLVGAREDPQQHKRTHEKYAARALNLISPWSR